MSPEVVVRVAEKSVYAILLISAPVLGLSLLVGLLVSILQATTQIQEQTLAFIPKIIAVFVSILLFGPWMLTRLLEFTFEIYNHLHRFIG
ncbi:flagellar biosynthesis protein FliQ [Bacillaceae bacterium]